MKGDYSKDTFDATQHYSSVRLQQGRVLMDADWNEQVDIERGRAEQLLRDVVGPSGLPEGSDGFALTQVTLPGGGRDVLIKPGRMYLDGLLCVCEEPEPGRAAPSYLNQPHYQSYDGPPAQGSSSVAYLEAFTRHLTVAEEPRLGDPAVGATATRTQTIWQVRISSSPSIDPRQPDWSKPLRGPDRTGLLSASLPQSATLPADNGLFRIEVNAVIPVKLPGGGQTTRVQCKWSRDNGSVVTFPRSISGDKISVVDSTGFRSGGYVEWAEERQELLSTPSSPSGVVLLKCADVKTGQLTIDISGLRDWSPTRQVTFPDAAPRPRLSFWDGSFEFDAAQSTTVELGGVIRVTLSSGVYQVGDYFLVTVRANAGILSPLPGQSVPARYVRHQFALLAELLPDGRVRDLRPRFLTLAKQQTQTDRRLRLLRDRQDAQVTLRNGLVLDRRYTSGADVTVSDWNDPTKVVNYVRASTTLYLGAQFEQVPVVSVARYSSSYRPSTGNTQLSLWIDKVQRDQVSLFHDTFVGAIDNAVWFVLATGRIRPMPSLAVLRDDATGDLHIFTTRYSDVRYRRYDAAGKRWLSWQNFGFHGGNALWSRPFPMMLDGKPIALFLDTRRKSVPFLRVPTSPDEPATWDGLSPEAPWWFNETFIAAPRLQRPIYPIASTNPNITNSRMVGVYFLFGARLMGCLFKDRAGATLDTTRDRRYPADWKYSVDNPGFWTQENRTIKSLGYPNVAGEWGGEYPQAQSVALAIDTQDTLERQHRDLNLEAPVLSIWPSPTSGNILFVQVLSVPEGDRMEAFFSTDGGIQVVPAIGQPVNRSGVLTPPTPTLPDSYRNRLSVLQRRGEVVNGRPYADTCVLWISPPVYVQRGSERVACMLLATGLDPLPRTGRQVNRLWSVVLRETVSGPTATLQLERTPVSFGDGGVGPSAYYPSALLSVPNPVATGVNTNNPGDVQAVAFVLMTARPGEQPTLEEMSLSNGTWSFTRWYNVLPPGVTPATPPSTVLLASGKVGCFLVGSDGHIYELGRQSDGSIYVVDHDLPLPDDGIA